MSDKPANTSNLLRPWSVVSDDELRKLRKLRDEFRMLLSQLGPSVQAGPIYVADVRRARELCE